MKKEWLETVLEVIPAAEATSGMPEEALFALHEGEATSGTREVPESRRIEGVVLGTLVDLKDSGEPLIDFPANRSGEYVLARSIIALGKNEIGREVALLFESGDSRKPIVMGLTQRPEGIQSITSKNPCSKIQDPVEAKVDGASVVITAKKEIVLRCGKASITLTRAGKVLIRGAYVLSRSSGVNRIKGGSVQIN